MSASVERIAVTGVGIISALGPNAATTFSRLIRGERGFSQVTLFDVQNQRTRIAAEIADLRVADVAPRGQAEAWSRTDAMAMLAAKEALESAGLNRIEPIGLAVGASTGGMYEAEAVLGSMQRGEAPEASARRLLSYPLSTTAEHISRTLRGVDRAVTLCSACSSGANAIVQGAAWLLGRTVPRVVVGGTDGLCSLTFTGFNSLNATDTGPCRPFDVERGGLSLGEGAAFLVLELESSARARGARVLAWLSGWAVAAEAHHITHPEPSGATAARLLKSALARAGLAPGDVDYINAHGTGTPHNDAMEARAIHAAFGDAARRVRVSSSKGQVGHTLAAAGAIEAAFTVLALEQSVLPPTGGLERPDPELDLCHVQKPQEAELRAALSSSFGFGGTGSVLVFERGKAPARAARSAQKRALVVSGAATVGPYGVLEGVANARYADPASSPAGERVEPLERLDAARSRRFDRAAALVSLAAKSALESAALKPALVGLVSGTAFGSVERSVEFLRRVAERGPKLASPAEFPHLVPSAPAGNASIYLGLTGPVLGVSDLSTSAEAAAAVAAHWVELGLADAIVAGSAEPWDAVIARVLGPLCENSSSEARGEGAAFVVLEAAGAVDARKGRALATVIHRAESWNDDRRLLAALPAPRRSDRARVLIGAGEDMTALLENTSWAAIERQHLSAGAGAHDALGGFALAAGSALVASGAADEVLTLGGARGRSYAFLLGRVDSDQVASNPEASA
jgi:3-oxoacyl-[acyl-carrier-protein] synthase II